MTQKISFNPVWGKDTKTYLSARSINWHLSHGGLPIARPLAQGHLSYSSAYCEVDETGVGLTGSGSGVGVAEEGVLEMRNFEGRRGIIFLSGNAAGVDERWGEVRCFLTFESSIVLDFPGIIFGVSGLGCGEGLLVSWGKGGLPRPS